MKSVLLAVSIALLSSLPSMADELRPPIQQPVAVPMQVDVMPAPKPEPVVATTKPSEILKQAGVTGYAKDGNGQITIVGTPDVATMNKLAKAYKQRQNLSLAKKFEKKYPRFWRNLRTKGVPAAQLAAILIGMGFSIAAAL